jgi:nucleoside-diphosphate-sugar epimerase
VTRVLVFGAGGFIGSHVHAAFTDDLRVEAVTAPGRSACDLERVDPGELRALMEQVSPDVVVNCTGRLDGSGYQLLLANALVTAKLLEAIAAVDSRIRFVRLGSAGEYGRVTPGTAVSEDAPAQPVAEYGLSHLTATRMTELAREAGRADAVTLRVFNPIGAGMRANVVGHAAARLREAVDTNGASITMGPLSAYRDFVDARDVASAVVAAAFADPLPASVVNIGGGQAVATRDAVRLVADLAGFTGEIREERPDSSRSSGVDWMLADISRARSQLRWQPAYELADSIKTVWEQGPATGGTMTGRPPIHRS